MITEDFHGRLCIWIVSRLETKFRHAYENNNDENRSNRIDRIRSYQVCERIRREDQSDHLMSNDNRRLNLRFDEIQPDALHRVFHYGKLYQSRSILPV
jgi:hypothetical protein